MSPSLVSDRPASVSILRILAMVIFGYIVMGNVVAMLIISILYQGNLLEALSDPLNHPDIRNIMLLAQGVASLVGLVLIPWYYLRAFEHRTLAKFFGGFPSLPWVLILGALVIALGVSISPIAEWNAHVQLPSWTGALGEFLRQFEDQAAVLVKAFLANLTPLSFLLAFVVIAVVPALGEELVFRGLIQNEFRRAFGNPHVAIWLSAAFFSAFHMQFFGFFPRLILGAVMGYVYYWSGNLWIPILLHFLNNGIQVVAIYLMQLKVHSLDVESTESAPWPYVAAALLLMAGLLYYCRKNLLPPDASSETPPAVQ
ncbi:MAG: CPBP family intramembrane metalloprotease [Cyclobacteriaceae bacterium]|nr:CPBP family intramembrane metalloprotease [Cyclobacteriaceae bacterium]